MSISLDRKIENLEKKIKEAEIGDEIGLDYTKYLNAPIIIGAATPLVLAGILAAVKPKFILKKDDDKDILDYKKLIQWTLIVSIIVWIGLYFYSYNQGSFRSLGACSCE